MRLLFNLFSIFALAPRPAVRPLLAVSGIGVANRSQIPDDMYYGMYALRDRYSMDQVPLQKACHTFGTLGMSYFSQSSRLAGRRPSSFSRKGLPYYDNFEKNHKIFLNFTGTSVKLSVSYVRHFTVTQSIQINRYQKNNFIAF